ncbi:hypothetical protein OK349_14885 [Sphingomonas sp. BT-65]|uniref:hypothetical protein n=1 Tax=Sphingomonas sp. BT-65 TaxID=2989821 RepID=UPI0022360921|nr:hypothetical protein [Sphingomonas sp. BT-65]MCW4462998.1 hypothetical protein [Sphingomonas sp. BT-65]
MKTLAIMVIALLAMDLALFRGAYTVEAWGLARSEMKAVRDFADEHTRLMPRD